MQSNACDIYYCTLLLSGGSIRFDCYWIAIAIGWMSCLAEFATVLANMACPSDGRLIPFREPCVIIATSFTSFLVWLHGSRAVVSSTRSLPLSLSHSFPFSLSFSLSLSLALCLSLCHSLSIALSRSHFLSLAFAVYIYNNIIIHRYVR